MRVQEHRIRFQLKRKCILLTEAFPIDLPPKNNVRMSRLGLRPLHWAYSFVVDVQLIRFVRKSSASHNSSQDALASNLKFRGPCDKPFFVQIPLASLSPAVLYYHAWLLS